MQAVETETRYRTLADIMKRVGVDVPYDRVRCYPAAGTATPEDAIDPAIVGDRGVELVGGVLVEKAVGYYDEYIAGRIFGLIFIFLQEHNLGALTGSQGGFRFATDLMRMPDVSFVRWDSLPDPDVIGDRETAFLETPPDLAVEVLRPGNTRKEMAIKLEEYARVGVKLVWYVDPDRQEVDVFPKARAKGKVTLGIGDTLNGGAILPGFTVPVAKLFEKPSPPGHKGGKGKPKKG